MLSSVAQLDEDSGLLTALQASMKIFCAMLTVLIVMPHLGKAGEEALKRNRGAMWCTPAEWTLLLVVGNRLWRVRRFSHAKWENSISKFCRVKIFTLQKGSGCSE